MDTDELRKALADLPLENWSFIVGMTAEHQRAVLGDYRCYDDVLLEIVQKAAESIASGKY